MSDPIQGRFVLTYSDQIKALWSQSRALRVAAILLLVTFLFTVLCEVLYRLFDSDESMLEPIAIMLAVVLSWPLLIVFGVWRLSPQQKDLTYLIDGERVLLRDAAGNEMSSPWSQIKSLRETKSGFVLKIGPGARWLARRAFAPDALAAFRRLAHDKLADKARLLA